MTGHTDLKYNLRCAPMHSSKLCSISEQISSIFVKLFLGYSNKHSQTFAFIIFQ